jgi:hypothetical protein
MPRPRDQSERAAALVSFGKFGKRTSFGGTGQ